MYFNVSQIIFRLFAGCIKSLFGMAFWLASRPLWLGFKLAGFAFAVCGVVAFKPAKNLLVKTVFKPVPPKKYIKIGKPAVPGIAAAIVAREAAMVMPYAYTTRTSREDIVKRTLLQQTQFVAKFNSQVVSV
jgi:hypothetical protein